MADDNFFNKSINEAPGTGFATSLVAAGDLATGLNYIAGTAAFAATFPPASVGPGVSVTLVVASVASVVTLTPDATIPDTINGGGATPAKVGVTTFVSDGVSNWIHTV